MEARYLRIKNWSRYQHYAKRRPPWIKLYNDLIGDGDEFENLTESEQWQLVRIWMIASRSPRFTVDEKDRVVPVVVDDEHSLRRSIQTLKRIPLAKFVRDGWLIPVADTELVDPDVASAVASTVASATASTEPLLDASWGASALLEPENQRTKELQMIENSPSPTPPSGQGGSIENGGTDFGTLKRLLALVPKDGRSEAANKVIRTVKANRSSEADLVAAIEAAAGANVRDPLAVILAELKKRAEARRAA